MTDGPQAGLEGPTADAGHDPIAAGERSTSGLGLSSIGCLVLAALLAGAGASSRDAVAILLFVAAATGVLTIVSWQIVSIRAARLGRRTPRRVLFGATLAGLVLVALLVVVVMVLWAAAHMN